MFIKGLVNVIIIWLIILELCGAIIHATKKDCLTASVFFFFALLLSAIFYHINFSRGEDSDE